MLQNVKPQKNKKKGAFSKNHIIISCRNCKLHRSCYDNLISYENIYSQHEKNPNKKVGISFIDLRLPSIDQWLAFTLYQFSFLKVFFSVPNSNVKRDFKIGHDCFLPNHFLFNILLYSEILIVSFNEKWI